MGPVETDVRFRRLAQVTGIRAVMHNGQVVEGQLERWPFDDLNVLSLLGQRKDLRKRRTSEGQAEGSLLSS
jgi:hypothetical protein